MSVGCHENVKDSKEYIRFERIQNERTSILTNNKWLIFNYKNNQFDVDLTLDRNLKDSIILEFRSSGELYLNESNIGNWRSDYFLHNDLKHISSHIKTKLKDKVDIIYISNAYYRFEFYGKNKQILRLIMVDREEPNEKMCVLTLYSLNLKE